MSVDVKKLLYATAFRTIDVEHLLNQDKDNWVCFDPVLGYIPSCIILKDGMDQSYSTYTYEENGARRLINYADKPCRINTYGDSFTECQQVSDGETWQEKLAAHIGEPIRNFGSGGYGVYQAYLRLLRKETTEDGAEYIVISIFDDDHVRNIDAARWIRTHWSEKELPPDKAYSLHGLPWSHLRYDLDEDRILELPGLCRNEADLRRLTDKKHFYECFKDDLIVNLFLLEIGGEVDTEQIRKLENLSEAIGVDVNLRDPARRQTDAYRLRAMYGFKSTEYILNKLIPWIETRGKKFMIVLCYSQESLKNFLDRKERKDQPFVNFLEKKGIPYINILEKHLKDYREHNLSCDEYVRRYYIQAAGAAVFGHYNPAGNLFYALSIKDNIVDWLNPKPPAYKDLP